MMKPNQTAVSYSVHFVDAEEMRNPLSFYEVNVTDYNGVEKCDVNFNKGHLFVNDFVRELPTAMLKKYVRQLHMQDSAMEELNIETHKFEPTIGRNLMGEAIELKIG